MANEDVRLRPYGLQMLLGENYDNFLEEIVVDHAEAVAQVAARRNLQLDDADQRLEAADEFLAEMAENDQNNSVWQQIAAAFRRFLRSIGFDLAWSDADLRDLLRRSRATLKQNLEVDGNGTVRFELKPTDSTENIPENIPLDKTQEAYVVPVPELPIDLTDVEVVRNYLKDRFQEMEVDIKSDGRPVVFYAPGLKATIKRKGEHRKSFSALDSIIEESYPVGYKRVDKRHSSKRPDLKGQFIYGSLIKIGNEEYIAIIKLDDSAASYRASFKDISIKKRPLYAGQTQNLSSENVIPPADRNISIQQLIDFVKSDFADSELFTEEMPPVKKKPERRFSISPEPEYSVAVDWPELL